MSGHPIETLMKTAMESIKDMVDVNTVVGDPVETSDGNVIIPISKVSAGFAAGGGEFDASGGGKSDNPSFPFGGGSGAGVSVKPVGFLVCSGKEVRLLPVDGNAIFDHLIDAAPRLLNQIRGICDPGRNSDTIHIKTQ